MMLWNYSLTSDFSQVFFQYSTLPELQWWQTDTDTISNRSKHASWWPLNKISILILVLVMISKFRGGLSRNDLSADTNQSYLARLVVVVSQEIIWILVGDTNLNCNKCSYLSKSLDLQISWPFHWILNSMDFKEPIIKKEFIKD